MPKHLWRPVLLVTLAVNLLAGLVLLVFSPAAPTHAGVPRDGAVKKTSAAPASAADPATRY